jgi:hypothetical protein
MSSLQNAVQSSFSNTCLKFLDATTIGIEDPDTERLHILVARRKATWNIVLSGRWIFFRGKCSCATSGKKTSCIHIACHNPNFPQKYLRELN